MKRIRVLTLVGAALLCALGAVLVLALSRQPTISIASIPPYPSATDPQTSNVKSARVTPARPGVLIGTLTFKTPDSTQSVHDYYDKWFSAHGWRSTGQLQGESRYSLQGMPDFSKAQVRSRPGSLLPALAIPRHYYKASVRATRLDQTTFVWVQVDDVAP